MLHTKSVIAQNPDIQQDEDYGAFRENFDPIQKDFDMFPTADSRETNERFTNGEPLPAQDLSNITPAQIQSAPQFEEYMWKDIAEQSKPGYYQEMSDDSGAVTNSLEGVGEIVGDVDNELLSAFGSRNAQLNKTDIDFFNNEVM